VGQNLASINRECLTELMQEGSNQKVELGTGNLGRLERCCLSCMGYIEKA